MIKISRIVCKYVITFKPNLIISLITKYTLIILIFNKKIYFMIYKYNKFCEVKGSNFFYTIIAEPFIKYFTVSI